MSRSLVLALVFLPSLAVAGNPPVAASSSCGSSACAAPVVTAVVPLDVPSYVVPFAASSFAAPVIIAQPAPTIVVEKVKVQPSRTRRLFNRR